MGFTQHFNYTSELIQNSSGNSEGVGGYFTGQKMEIPGRRGAYMKFPPWWGMEGTTHLTFSSELMGRQAWFVKWFCSSYLNINAKKRL